MGLEPARRELRAGGYEVRDEDAARLSPFVRHHVNMLGCYSFLI
ncbi:Tn3 family transposase [Saccharopolyspora shandongensis]